MKKLTLKTFLLFITAIITFIPLSKTLAGQKTTIYFFWGQECPHCAKEKIFLEKLGEKYPELEIKSFEIYSNALSLELFRQTAQAYNIPVQGIPTTFIGEQVVTGFDNDETTGRKIENLIKNSSAFIYLREDYYKKFGKKLRTLIKKEPIYLFKKPPFYLAGEEKLKI